MQVGPVPARIGLTGGIGTGKSHVLSYLARHGVPTVDADDLARAVVAPGEPALRAVVERFGGLVLDVRGALDRKALAGIVFGNARARQDLEAIVHPAVWQAIGRWFASLDGVAGVAAVPLLFETGHADDFDKVLVTSCSEDRQVARVARRDGLSADEVRRRLAAQMRPEERLARADAVIDTNGSEAETDRQVAAVWSGWGLPALGGPGGV